MYLQIFQGFLHFIPAKSVSKLKLGAVFAILEVCNPPKPPDFIF